MGKSSAPAAPDYTAAAKETAAGNLDAARYATQANRINQYTPYGSLTYSQANTPDSFDQAGYDAALSKYQAGQSTSTTAATGFQGRPGFGQMDGDGATWGAGSQGAQGASGPAPNRNDYVIKGTQDGPWTQTETLTPQAQATLDKQMDLSNKYADVANIGFDKARASLENPELDVSKLPARAINVGQTAQQAILSRLNPQFAQREEATRARLANQGITLGSNAYGQEMTQQDQARNDAEIAASLQGINLDQQNRSSALEEQAYLQDRPLNLVNALRSGAQVQSPQFQNFAQQATTAGPDYLGAASQQYQADLNSTNASNAASSGLVSGLLGTGLAVAGMGTGGGATLGGAALKGLFK